MAELFPDSPLQAARAGSSDLDARIRPCRPDFVPLEGIEKGCKTIVVFSPQPIWPASGRSTIAAPPPKRGQLAFQLAGNIIAYATGLEMPKPRLTEPKIFDTDEEKRDRRAAS